MPVVLTGTLTIADPAGSVTLRNGFQYTSVDSTAVGSGNTVGGGNGTPVRHEQFRRLPSISIQEALNNAPNQMTVSIDGDSPPPKPGEEIIITDTHDGNRTVFAGNVQTVLQVYEDQIDQLRWDISAADYTWQFNRKRPFGNYVNIPADQIVKDLVGKYAVNFTTGFVQTNLAAISVTFDGTEDLITALTRIAKAIGGGHWFVDYNRVVHFFHIKPDVKPFSPMANGPGTAVTLSVGAQLGGTSSFDPGYYYVRTTFLYSNKVESRLGPASNVVGYDGTKFIHGDGVPIGTDPGNGITCIGRRVYLQKGTGPLKRFLKITDNSTTSFDAFPGMASSGVLVYEGAAPIVKVPATTTATPPPPVTAPTASGSGKPVGYTFPQGNYTFTAAILYSDGTIGQASPPSNIIFLGGVNGVQFSNLPKASAINGVSPVAYVINVASFLPTHFGGAGSVTVQGSPLVIGNIPYSGDGSATGSVLITPPDLGARPVINPNAPPAFTWPNNDGPFLEGGDLPNDLVDGEPTLLHESDDGTPGIQVETDTSQIRNKVIVLGAASQLTADAATGDTEIKVGDVSIFTELGGTVIANGAVFDFFSADSSTSGAGSVFLATPLPSDLTAGTPIRLYFEVEDYESQQMMGAVELDASGNPTDGVHEYVVSDPSMIYPQQLYVAGNAEIEIFSKPIQTIEYYSRDTKSKPGKMVHVDLTDPPIQGDFLIQTVTIDQYYDESDQVGPRFHVTASSSKFTLEDLLLQILKPSQIAQVVAGQSGAVAAAAGNAANLSDLTGIGRIDFRARAGLAAGGTTSATTMPTGFLNGPTLSFNTTGKIADGLQWHGQQVQGSVGGAQNPVSSNVALTNPGSNPKISFFIRFPTATETDPGGTTNGGTHKGWTTGCAYWWGLCKTNAAFTGNPLAGAFIYKPIGSASFKYAIIDTRTTLVAGDISSDGTSIPISPDTMYILTIEATLTGVTFTVSSVDPTGAVTGLGSVQVPATYVDETWFITGQIDATPGTSDVQYRAWTHEIRLET